VVDDQDRIAASLLETPTAGFAVFDLRGYWQLTERLLVIAGVENLTDRNYREHLDYRTQSGLSMFQPGVNFYFGSELTY
jgi:outer membrane receptor protein involved in Fe transport